MRVAVAQINPTLLDFKLNFEKILSAIEAARARHCDLIIFPESSLLGYHPFDLLELETFAKKQLPYLQKLSKKVPEKMGVLFGTILPSKKRLGKPYYNSAIFLERGKKPKVFNKQLLPTGDVFDEARFIENGALLDNLLVFRGKRIFITICEDIWAWPDAKGMNSYVVNPLVAAARRNKNVDLVLNLSASPYFPQKEKVRTQLVSKTAQLFKAPMVYCNMVGAQDEIIFDGQSFAVDKRGKELLRLSAFEEDFGILDLNKVEASKRPKGTSEAEMIRKALILGLRDFCQKSGLKKVHLGLSGGIDSAVTACLAVDALGPGNVKGFALTSQFTSKESVELAHQLSANLGLAYQEVSLVEIFRSTQLWIDQSLSLKEFGLVHENLQARLRGLFLMAYSNATGSLLLSTSNKSEAAVGYSTLYGDMSGGLMPIGDLLKKQVYELAHLYNQEREIIPTLSITREPSAELRPGQKDSDSLPEYSQLDQAVERIVVDGRPRKGKLDHFVLSSLIRSEFKRWQAPPILKVSRHAFGRGRRWPLAHGGARII